MNSRQPLVTCIVPTRPERQHFWPMLFRCFQRQQWESRELILVDEAPLTIELPPSVRHVEVPRNTSIGKKLNLGVELSSSNYFSKWDDDDWYHRDFLKTSIHPLLLHSPSSSMLPLYLIFLLKTWNLYFMPNVACAGGSICFDRASWQRKKFKDASFGEDLMFIKDRIDLIRPQPNVLSTYVVIRHTTNTWGPKTAVPVERIIENTGKLLPNGPERFFPPDDLLFYHSLRSNNNQSQTISSSQHCDETTILDRTTQQKSECGSSCSQRPPDLQTIPLVTCIVPTTRKRQQFWPMLFRCFRNQTWHNKELVLVSEDPIDIEPPPGTRIITVPPGTTIGNKINIGVESSSNLYFCKWDDDDWYHQEYLSNTVAHIIRQEPSIAMTANHMILFLKKWELYHLSGDRCAGGTICFNRAAWKQRPFEDLTHEEDWRFIRDRDCLITMTPNLGLSNYMLVRHENNTWTDWESATNEVDRTLAKIGKKQAQGPERFLLPEDLGFYRKLRLSLFPP